MTPSPTTQGSDAALMAFRGRRVFVTGHTGFKGSWLSVWLQQLGAEVYGYALPPAGPESNFECSQVATLLAADHRADVRDRARLVTAVLDASPDVIFHLAAQPLVRESYAIPHETHEINYMGTCNLLEAVRELRRPCAVVIVTTDKCYENKEQIWGYREIDALGGHDPYSASKAAAELLARSYRDSFFPAARLAEHGVAIATARAGNVIGGGDWAKDRIVPDMVRSLVAGQPVCIRSPRAVRPWQHVLEPVHGYLRLAERLLERRDGSFADAWNFGPTVEGHQTVGDLVALFHRLWGAGECQFDADARNCHETTMLSLSIDKAIARLQWCPTWDFPTTIARTVAWYRAFTAGRRTMLDACRRDIHDFAIRARVAGEASAPEAGPLGQAA